MVCTYELELYYMDKWHVLSLFQVNQEEIIKILHSVLVNEETGDTAMIYISAATDRNVKR